MKLRGHEAEWTRKKEEEKEMSEVRPLAGAVGTR